MTTVHTVFCDGVPISVPNRTINKTGYYISYNNRDTGIYGSDTTALVTLPRQTFYILNGDHTKEYNQFNSVEDCMDYFMAHENLKNKYSE